LLGPSFDIHGGGLDLQFPHHENEIAQSACAHPQADFARVWMHNEMLQVEGKKMSKSLGNFFTVRDLLDQGVPGEVIRFVMLGTHYSKPMDWRRLAVSRATQTLRKWRAALEGVKTAAPPTSALVEAIADDLNTPLALTALHQLYRDRRYSELASSAWMLGLLSEEMGSWFEPPALTDQDKALVSFAFDLRQKARNRKDFRTADTLRALLEASGILIEDGKSPPWRASFARIQEGWLSLAKATDDSGPRIDFEELSTLARRRNILLGYVQSGSFLTEGFHLNVDTLPNEIDRELLQLSSRFESFK